MRKHFFKVLTTCVLIVTAVEAVLEAAQVVVITGASRGIGLATAELLAQEGYAVYGGIRKTSDREPINAAALRCGGSLYPIELDVTDQSSVDSAIKTILEKEGHIDVLVNNAGIGMIGSPENFTVDESKQIFDVNFFGVLRLQNAVLPAMRTRKSGKIIQISSRSGFRPLPSLSIYAASKFALEGMSETLAAVLKQWNITVSLIEPGPVLTDFDFELAYGTNLPPGADPYFKIFENAGLLDPFSSISQEVSEIAQLIKSVIEEEQPLFRYQTTAAIQAQAASRFVDPTGLKALAEWDAVLYGN